VTTYEAWSSPEAKKMRFRAGLQNVPALPSVRPDVPVESKTTRFPGELNGLALLARGKFDSKYRRTGPDSLDRV
jgi:hypothetical protein